MSKRKYREASQAKRLSPDDIALARAFGGPTELTPAQTLEIDHAYNAFKNDPQAFDRKLHAMHQEEVSMARTLLGRAG